MDVLGVIIVLASLPGPLCYGKIAPLGSSCQITSSELKHALGLNHLDESSSLSLHARAIGSSTGTSRVSVASKALRLRRREDKSLEKTALMNIGAETRLYMQVVVPENEETTRRD
jgi:hypothetical protein